MARGLNAALSKAQNAFMASGAFSFKRFSAVDSSTHTWQTSFSQLVRNVQILRSDLRSPICLIRRRRRVSLGRRIGTGPKLEVHFQGELILPWGVVRIGLRDTSESRIPEACSAATVSDVEVWRV